MSEPWPGERSTNGGVDAVPLGAGRRVWLCGKRFVGPDPERALARTGATTVVCLNERHELGHHPDYVEWLDAAGERHVWFPIPDLSAPPVEGARLLLDELRRRIEDGEELLIHCGAGIGRAGTVAAALLVLEGVDVDDAIATVAAHRPLAGPEAGAQRDLLEALAAAR